MSLVNLSAMGYPKLKTFRVLQEGVLLDCRFELRGELPSESEIDHALYVFRKEHSDPIMVVTSQVSSSSNGGIMILYSHLGPKVHFTSLNNYEEFLNKSIDLARKHIESIADASNPKERPPIQYFPLISEGNRRDYGLIGDYRYDTYEVVRSAGIIQYQYIMYCYGKDNERPVFCVSLEAQGESGEFILTIYGTKRCQQLGVYPDLVKFGAFQKYASFLANEYLLNPEKLKILENKNIADPLMPYGFNLTELRQTLELNQSYTRIILSTLLICLGTIPYLISTVPYVGGVFLALFYVMNVFGVWILFEGVRRNKVPWKLSVMIPALLPLYINLSGGILLFLLMSFSLLSILRRQLLKTGLTI